VPLAVGLTGTNRNDSQEALALVDAIPPLPGKCGRPFRRLRVRYDKRADIHEAFLSLGALICWRSLRKIWRTG
jgi:hypothetical protein